jgi:CBS domain-containing protein
MDRRGYHLRTELDVDPLEVLLVRDVLPDTVTTLPADLPLRDAAAVMIAARASSIDAGSVHQRLYPVVDDDNHLLGVLPRRVIIDALLAGRPVPDGDVLSHAISDPIVAAPGETLRTVANRMAERALTRLPVVDDDGTVVGVISLAGLLAGRLRDVAEARDARRLIRIKIAIPMPGGRQRQREADLERPSPRGSDTDADQAEGEHRPNEDGASREIIGR